MFNKYPYTDFHELNLDWVIEQVQMLLAKIDDLVNMNTIKYADPIDWSIVRQYEQNTIVIDKSTYNTYLSKLAVPVGIDINNNDYWLLIGNFSDAIKEVSDRVDELDEKIELEIEPDITILQEDSLHIANMVAKIWLPNLLYNVGQYVTNNNNLYRCLIQNMGVSPTNTDYWAITTVGDEFISTKNSIESLDTVFTQQRNISFNETGFSDDLGVFEDDIISVRVFDRNVDHSNWNVRLSHIGSNEKGVRLWLYNEFTNEKVTNVTLNCVITYTKYIL